MQHNILIFIKISTWIGFNYPPKIRPKNTKLCIRLVLQEKIRHTHHMPHVSTNILTISLSPFMTASIKGDTLSALRSLEISWGKKSLKIVPIRHVPFMKRDTSFHLNVYLI